MHLVSGTSGRSTGTLATAVRSPIPGSERLDELVADIHAVRPRLLDAWEATALVESLGYTDARASRELGFHDTLALGQHLFTLSRANAGAIPEWAPKTESLGAIVTRSAASTLIYAVPWLTVVIAQTVNPDAMRLPARLASVLALALMFSLIWSGGWVQAIVRRGQFYVGLRQFGLARELVLGTLRIGVALTVAAGLAGILVGWYFELFPGPALVIGADAFIVMSVLWMVCGIFAIRHQQWRVSIAFAVGFITFAIVRALGADVLAGQLIAATAVLVAAAVQVPRVFGDGTGAPPDRPRGVPLPRLSVVVYWTVPYFWYGAAYFAFLFADRLAAGTALAALTNAPFGVPPAYNIGMELALLTLLVAASGVEVAAALFARAIAREAVRPLRGDSAPLTAALRRHHLTALARAVTVFVVTAVAVVPMATRFLPAEPAPLAWSTLLAGDIGYGCLAAGFVNALVLFEIQSPWLAVQTLTAALGINLASGYVLSHLLGSYHAVDGLLLGAAYFAVASTIAVRRTLRYADYAYAAS